jgi:hypothetical protein
VPVPAETQKSEAALGFVPVAFHESSRVPVAAHETLLKASMPANSGSHPVMATAAKRRRSATAPILQRTRRDRAKVPQVRGWVMLTSWEMPERPRMILSVSQERVIFTSYAAVPTAGGWLVIQL